MSTYDDDQEMNFDFIPPLRFFLQLTYTKSQVMQCMNDQHGQRRGRGGDVHPRTLLASQRLQSQCRDIFFVQKSVHQEQKYGHCRSYSTGINDQIKETNRQTSFAIDQKTMYIDEVKFNEYIMRRAAKNGIHTIYIRACTRQKKNKQKSVRSLFLYFGLEYILYQSNPKNIRTFHQHLHQKDKMT